MFPHNDPHIRAQFDAMQDQFMAWLTEAPLEAVQALEGKPVEFWHEPDEAAGHFTFAVALSVEQVGEERRVRLMTVGDTPDQPRSYEIPAELVRMSPGPHPYLRHLLESARYAERVQAQSTSDRAAVKDALRMRDLAWRTCKAAFVEGLPGERPQAARIRLEDLRRPDLWGLTREEPGPLRWGGP